MSGDFWSYDQTRDNLASLIVVDELGAGSYSTVYKGIYRDSKGRESEEETRRTCAIKQQAIYEQDDCDCGVSYSFLTELNNLQLFRHYNIVKLYGAFFYLDTTNLVCEQMDCDLTYYIKAMPAQRRLHHTRKLLVSLVKAVMLLNDLGYHHFDIKPSNVLVNFPRVTSQSMSLDDSPEEEDVFKLTDFGIAFSTAAYFDYRSKEVCTLWYRPPELHADQCYYKDRPDLLSKGDIWSIGLTVLEMITKRAVVRVKSASELPPILMNLVDPLYLFGVPLTRHQRQSFDWLKALRKDLLRGHLDLVQIISPELFIELNHLDSQSHTRESRGGDAKLYDKGTSRVVKILQEMLEISAKHRISGDDILYLLDEKVELNYLEDNYGRFISPANIRVLIKLGLLLECSDETLVYALDFLLRYEHQVRQGPVTVIIPQLNFSDECELELNPIILKKRSAPQTLYIPLPLPPPQIKSISLSPQSSEESTDTLDIDQVVRETMMNESPIRPLSSTDSSFTDLEDSLTKEEEPSSRSGERSSKSEERLEVLGSKIKLEEIVGVEMIEIIAILKLAADLNQPGRYMSDDLLNLITWNKEIRGYRQEFIEAQKRVLTGINFTLSTYFNQIYIEWLHNNKGKAIKWKTMSKMDEFSWLKCFFDEDLDLDDFFDTKGQRNPE